MNRLFLILGLFLIGCSNDVESTLDISIPSEISYRQNYHGNYNYNNIVIRDFEKLESTFNRLPYLFNDVPYGTDWTDVPHDLTILDYNNDGNLDLVYSNSDYKSSFSGVANRRFFNFFLGDSNGNLTLDVSNHEKFVGTIHARKSIIGDWNGDGFMDMFFASSGIDGQTGVQYTPNDYPILFINDKNGSFIEYRLNNEFNMFPGYWHSVTSSDIDGDGISEIVLIQPASNRDNESKIIQFNNNKLSIRDLQLSLNDVIDKFTSESVDLNGDGIDELILGGSDTNPRILENHPSGSFVYNYQSKEKIYLPTHQQDLLIDMVFYDLDNDGDLDIIASRTRNYSNGYIQIIRNDITEFVDVTSEYMPTNFTHTPGQTMSWIEWLYIGDFNGNGNIELHTSDIRKPGVADRIEWEFIGGKFIKK
jgi:hypothetical protein